MTLTQQIIMIGVVVLGTMVTRFLPFLIFPQGKTPPKFVQYLGTVLPTAVIGLLVVYGLKDAPVQHTACPRPSPSRRFMCCTGGRRARC